MWLDKKDDRTVIRSEGKVLEITPIILDTQGMPWYLPPCRYQIPNWVLGYEDDHVQASVMTYQGQVQTHIYGSTSNRTVGFSYMLRVYEDSPDMVSQLPEIAKDLVEKMTIVSAEIIMKTLDASDKAKPAGKFKYHDPECKDVCCRDD